MAIVSTLFSSWLRQVHMGLHNSAVTLAVCQSASVTFRYHVFMMPACYLATSTSCMLYDFRSPLCDFLQGGQEAGVCQLHHHEQDVIRTLNIGLRNHNLNGHQWAQFT